MQMPLMHNTKMFENPMRNLLRELGAQHTQRPGAQLAHNALMTRFCITMRYVWPNPAVTSATSPFPRLPPAFLYLCHLPLCQP